MNCHKDQIIPAVLLLTVITIISGVFFDQLDSVNAELDKRTEIVYSVPSMQEDISEIKTDIKEIKNYLISGDFSK
jgi:hypothetical protein